MEKKSSGFRRLGRFFKGRSSETEKGSNGVPSQDTGQTGEETGGRTDGASPKESPVSKEQMLPTPTPTEVKKKPFGSWRTKRKNISNVSITPPASPGFNDRSFETPEEDIRPHSMFSTSLEDTESTISSEKDYQTSFHEDLDKSKASPTESPKKDPTRKPVLGKFGNLFNTSKRKPVRGASESPTSPTEKTVTTYKSEKEVLKERKKVILVASTSKVQTQARSSLRVEPASDQFSQRNSNDFSRGVGQSERDNVNGNGNIALSDKNAESKLVKEIKQTITEKSAVHTDAFSNSNETSAQNSTLKIDTQNSIVPPVKELQQTRSEGATAPTNILSNSSQKSAETSTPKVYRQNSYEKNVRNGTQSPGRRSSMDGETTKLSVRRLHVSSLEESPKIVTRKTSRFSGKVTDSKYKISDKPVQKLGSTEKLNSAKLPFQVTSQGDSQDQGSPPAEQNISPDSAGGSSILRRQASSGDLSPAVSPLEGDIFTESPKDKPKNYKSNIQANNEKVLAFDIYLSKTESNSPTSTRSSTSGETMEKSSPSSRKPSRKRRSFKSQSSQNEEKKIENVVLQDDVFDEGSFKGTTEKSAMSDSKLKPAPVSPESNGTVSANQEIKAGANHKLLPKGESDKDKQQHPTSSPLRKKNPTAWVSSSPTVRKAQTRDPVFRNQSVAAAAKAFEFNQPAPVSTTKDAYVEKARVPGSLTGSGGEDSNDTVRNTSPTAAGVQDKKTKHESIPGVQAHSTTESVTSKKSHNSDVPLNDNNKSTITSKLNIPPKPKNVELPVKPKAVDVVEESSVEVVIPKGNIASKVSLFESKKTSHRQIDFYATKNISQPKKFVERAKLNFGKQVKGNVAKDSSSTAKSVSESNFYSNKKTENGHVVVKKDTKDKSANHKVDCKESEGTSQAQGNLMPMEESRNDLETAADSIKPPQESESILPSAENEEQEDSPTELTNDDLPLPESITQSNDLEQTNKAEELLLPTSQVSDDTLGGNTAVLKSSSDSSLDIGHIEMGNKQSSLRAQSSDDSSFEEPNTWLPQDPTAIPCDLVDVAMSGTLLSNTDQLQMNVNKESIGIERLPEEPTLEDEKTKPNQNETIQTKDTTQNNVNAGFPNGDGQLPIQINNRKSDDHNVVPTSDLAQGEIMDGSLQEKSKQTTSNKVENSKDTLNGVSLEQDDGEYDPSYLVQEEKSSPASGTMVSDVSIKDNQEPITELTQNAITCSDETSNEFEGVNVVAEGTSLPDESTPLTENTLPPSSVTADKIEDNQAILSPVVTSQDQIIISAEIQTQNGSSVSSQDPELSVESQDQDTVVAENVADATASYSETTEEVEPQLTSNEHEVLPPVIEPKDDHSPNTIYLPANIKDPSISELDVAVAVDNGTENIDGALINHTDEKNEYTFSVTSNNDVAGIYEQDSVDPRARTLQNGCYEDSYTNTHYNEKIQQTEINQNFPDVQKSLESSFNTSIGGEDNVLDSSSDMEIFAETIRKLDSPITLPQKRKTPRPPKSPGSYYGLPPIREDYLEKILDNDAFSFGLGKKDRARDIAPMALFKLQSKETAEKMKPKRASTEQSMLLKSLRLQREPQSVPQETCDKENADVTDVAVKRSRIESIYSGLKSPFAAREENVFSPTVTTVSTITTSFDTPRKEFTPPGKTCDLKTTDFAKSAHTVPSSGFSQSMSTDSLSTPVQAMGNNLGPKDGAHANLAVSLPAVNGQSEENHCTTDGEGALSHPESSQKIDNPTTDFNDIFYFKGKEQGSSVPDLRSEVQYLQGAEKVNPRPGKLVILTEAEFGGAVFEVFADIPDCTAWELSPTIFIKTIRGCWLLYELPNFEGRTIPIEEGDIEVTNPWGVEQEEEASRTPVVIGSLRHVVKDYRVCQIDLFTDPGGLGIMTSHVDDTEEVQVYGRLQRTCSIKVHCGVWLIYEEAGFQGIPFILEPGEYPDLSFWNTQEAYIGSLRPLKMGSRKVEIPYEQKIIIFEKPMFEGRQVELDKETMTFENLEIPEGSEEDASLPFTTVGSMRVLSGLWVGFEKPGFEGHQYLLEEGDYEEWSHWGGYNELLQSLRPVLSDFSTPHMIMYSEKNFDEKAANINVLGIIANMEDTGFGAKIQSIKILSGVWVAYECPDFTGEQYILEKGMYSNFSDWGAKNCKISSVQPILMETLESPWGHFKVEVFSEPDFQGQNQIYEGDLNSIEDSFKIMSCKVSLGRWALYDQADFSGNLWVLEEGIFPNLCAMGCPHDATIRSLKTISYEFSEPSVELFGTENFKGRKVKVSKESTDLQAMGYSPDLMSLEVLGGVWVFYEYANYRGQQLLVSPSKIAKWKQFSGWNRIGSLRPLQQKRLYFKLRNQGSGMMMSTNGNMDDVKLLRIQITEDNGAEDQIWVYQKGVIRCRIAEDCSLAGAGTLLTTGTKLGFSLDEPGTSPVLWNISPEGRIHCRSKPNLVLDVKGGGQFDQQHIILNPVTEGKLTQLWEICVL